MSDLTVEGLAEAFDRMREVDRVLRDRRRHGILELVHVSHRPRHQGGGADRIEWRDPDAVLAWLRRGPR